MSSVGNARSSLSPAEVSLAGAASGAITRSVTPPVLLLPLLLPLSSLISPLISPLTCLTVRLICQPLDVAKIRLQLQAESGGARKYSSLVELLVKLPREEGLRALWKGEDYTSPPLPLLIM